MLTKSSQIKKPFNMHVIEEDVEQEGQGTEFKQRKASDVFRSPQLTTFLEINGNLRASKELSAKYFDPDSCVFSTDHRDQKPAVPYFKGCQKGISEPNTHLDD